MAEVIDIFTRKKILGEKPKEEIKDEPWTELSLTEIRKDLISDLLMRVKTIENLPSSSTTDASLFSIVDSYTMDELVEWIRKSTESDWTKRPAFFKAIAKKLRALCREPLEQSAEEEDDEE